jgi:hypothetical protein
MSKIVVCAVALLAFACGGSSNSPQTVFNAAMNGANETPANSSTATGTAQFTLTTAANPDGGAGIPTMNWTASSSPLSGTLTAFQVYLGDAGVAGAPVVTLTSGLIQNSADRGTDGGGSFTAPDPTATNADGGPMSFDDLVEAMRVGQTYVNIKDRPTYTAGEIRGQLGK